MAFDWKSFMEGRLQDREIRKYMDGSVVQQAYGGMRFRDINGLAGSIGTTPEKITSFDTALPVNSPPVGISFDQSTSEVVIGDDQGGVYLVIFFVDFQGEQGEVYTIQARVDAGGGPVDVGDPLLIRVSNAAGGLASIERTSLFRPNGGWRVSLWASADAANTTFNLFVVGFEVVRISPQLPDQ